MLPSLGLFWGFNRYFHSPPLSHPAFLLNPSDLVLSRSAAALLLCIRLLRLQPFFISFFWCDKQLFPCHSRRVSTAAGRLLSWLWSEYAIHAVRNTLCSSHRWNWRLPLPHVIVLLFFSQTCLVHWGRPLDASPPRMVFNIGYGWVWRLAPRVTQF